jgi:hypothetical protein
MDEKELSRQREEHNQRLLKTHLAKLRAAPERFARTTTLSGEAELEGKFQAEWEEFKRRHAGRIIQRQSRPTNPRADLALLGLTPQASRVEIRRAFLMKAKTAHPDLGGNADAFRSLMEAYHRLTEGKG